MTDLTFVLLTEQFVVVGAEDYGSGLKDGEYVIRRPLFHPPYRGRLVIAEAGEQPFDLPKVEVEDAFRPPIFVENDEGDQFYITTVDVFPKIKHEGLFHLKTNSGETLNIYPTNVPFANGVLIIRKDIADSTLFDVRVA